jgi:hypothetical protein
MEYTVYQTTNLINGKIYVGVHQTNDPLDNYLGSGSAIGKAIEKYGRDNFQKTILFRFDTIDEAYLKEREIVNETFIDNPLTYNLVLGGSGGWHRRESNAGKVIARDSAGNRFLVERSDCRFLSGEIVAWNKGAKRSAESNLKTSASLMGKRVGPKNFPKINCEICGKQISINAKSAHQKGSSCKPQPVY